MMEVILVGGSYGLNTSANNVTQTAGVTPESLSGRDILLFKIDTNINFQWASVIGGANSKKAIGVRTNKDNGYCYQLILMVVLILIILIHYL